MEHLSENPLSPVSAVHEQAHQRAVKNLLRAVCLTANQEPPELLALVWGRAAGLLILPFNLQGQQQSFRQHMRLVLMKGVLIEKRSGQSQALVWHCAGANAERGMTRERDRGYAHILGIKLKLACSGSGS